LGQNQPGPVGDIFPIAAKGDESRFDAILDAAESVFASSGYEGAKMRQIARGWRKG